MLSKLKSKYFTYTLRFGVAGTALYLTFKDNFGEVIDVLLGLHLWIAAVMALFVVCNVESHLW